MVNKLSLDEFAKAIEQRVSEELGNLYEVRLLKILKNNNVSLWGLCIRCANRDMAPNIYLNAFYDKYIDGRDFEDSVMDVLIAYNKSNKNMPSLMKGFDWDEIQGDVILKLVNYEMNKELFKGIPYKRFFGNLAVTFHILVGMKDGIQTVRINNELFNRFGIPLEKLYNIALSNTMKWFPVTIRSMNEVICSILEKENDGSDEYEEIWDTVTSGDNIGEMFVLSNNAGVCGATTILYPNIIKKFSEMMGTDIYIIPSSIHEVILLPDFRRDFNISILDNMVKEVNNSQVPLEDVLGNCVYIYKSSINDIIQLLGQ